MASTDHQFAPLRCPSCTGDLVWRDDTVRCTDCGESIPVVDGISQFPVADDDSETTAFFDRLSPIYETPLWFPVLYRVIGGPFAPLDDRRVVAEFLEPGGADLSDPARADAPDTAGAEVPHTADDGVPDTAGVDVLDVACGTGRFTRYVADDAAFVWGIDTSDGMLRRARRSADRAGHVNVAFARMDATALQFHADAFDRVACCWALHLFPDVAEALAEIRRVLKPGGRFAGTTLTDDALLAIPGTKQGLQTAMGAAVFDADELRAALGAAGFSRATFDRRGAALFFGAQ